MKTEPLKENELRGYATCARCQKKIGETPLPVFYLVSIERHGLKLDAIRRQNGLGELLGGHGGIAMAMGANEDMTVPLMDKGTVMICEPCGTQEVFVAELAELVNQKAKALMKQAQAEEYDRIAAQEPPAPPFKTFGIGKLLSTPAPYGPFNAFLRPNPER